MMLLKPKEPETDNRNENLGRTQLWRPLILIIFIVGALVIAHLAGYSKDLNQVRPWIQGLGFWGYLAFIGIFILAAVAALPGAPITAGAGILFHPFIGVVLVSIGSTLGACLVFFITRFFARDAVAVRLARNPKFIWLESLIERHGALIVFLTRLIPVIPYNILNYGLGLTAVRFSPYLLWSWLGMLPTTTLYVVGADLLFDEAVGNEVSIMSIVILCLLLSALTLAAIVTRRWFQRRAEP